MRLALAALALFVVAPVTADEVVDELSRRSLVSVEDLTDYLANCDRDQVSMNFCAFRDAVEVDLRLEAAIEARKAGMTAKSAAKLDAEITRWRDEMADTCNQQADEEAEGGSMRPAVYSFCAASETEKRLTELSE